MKKLKLVLGLIILISLSIFIFKISTFPSKETSTVVNSSKNTVSNDLSNEEYSILVQSPIYDAIVALDKNSKEINVKILDDSNILSSDDTFKYINLTEEDIIFLKENANDLLREFENGSLLDKYSFISELLQEYDTNIKIGDLINIAMSYLK